jgi:hypothetical protein
MSRVLSWAYSSMPQGVEHYNINAIGHFNRNAVTTDAIRRFLSFYLVHTLTNFLSHGLIKIIEQFLACNVDDFSLLKLCSQVRNVDLFLLVEIPLLTGWVDKIRSNSSKIDTARY